MASTNQDKPISEQAKQDFDLSQIDYMLSLTPEERIIQHDIARELVEALRQAGREYYGFDPQLAETAE